MKANCYLFEVGKTYSIDGPVSNAMDNEVGRQFTVKQRNDRSTVVTNPLAKKPGYISMAMVFEKVGEDIVGYEILVLPKDTWGNDVKIKMTENGAVRVMPKVKKEKKSKKSELKTELIIGEGQHAPEENANEPTVVNFVTSLVNNGEVLNDEEVDETPVQEETVEVAAKVEPKSKKSKAKRKK